MQGRRVCSFECSPQGPGGGAVKAQTLRIRATHPSTGRSLPGTGNTRAEALRRVDAWPVPSATGRPARLVGSLMEKELREGRVAGLSGGALTGF